MALKRLNTGEMVSLSAPWAQEGHADRLLFTRIPAISALLPQIDDAHATLLGAQVKPVLSDRLKEIVEEQRVLDIRHDNLIRGCFALPQALAYLTADADLAKELMHLQEVLLPDGLAATQKTYRDEAGQASLLESRLTPTLTASLKKIKTSDGTLLDAVKEWIRLGGELGRLEDERAGMTDPSGTLPADVVAARNKWIRTVNAIRTVLALVGADEPGVQAVLSRVDEAERKADRRATAADFGVPVPEDPPPGAGTTHT